MINLEQMTSVQVCGIVLLLAGLITRLLIGKNRFERRGLGGLYDFDCNYWLALIITVFEWLLAIASYASIVVGLFLLAIEWFNKP